MRRKMSFKKTATLALSLACAVTATAGAVSLKGASADSGVTLVYGARAFSVTEDYNYLTDYAYANETTLSSGEKTRTGTLMKATKTGASAEGTSFSIKETQTENFSMEFRVFSRSTYKQTSYGQTTHYGTTTADEYNPFLDLKAVDFTFTSVSDGSQSFTVHFNGATGYFAYRTSVQASVNGGAKSAEVQLNSTSFSNLDWYNGVEYNTVPNTVNFDVATGAITANNKAVYTLGASDLANYADGYTVKVTYTDVTANDVTGNEVALAWNNYEQSGDGYAGPLSDTFTDLSADIAGKDVRYTVSYNGGSFSEKFTGYNVATGRYIGDLGYDAGVGTAYAREAQMLVYSVNRQTVGLESVTGNTLVYNEREFTTTQDYNYLTDYANANADTLTSGEKDLTGALMKANKTGTQAEGASFSVKETQTDDFSMDFRVFSKTSYKHNGITWETHWGDWNAIASDDYNPFLDLKEVQIVFTSVSDPLKTFTLHMRGGITFNANMTGAYVSVNGGSTIGTDPYSVKPLYGTSFSNYSSDKAGGEKATIYNSVGFDLQTGAITAKSYNQWLSAEMVTTVYTLETAELANYANGYTVSVKYADVTANSVTGNELAQAFATAQANAGIDTSRTETTFASISATVNGNTFNERYKEYNTTLGKYNGSLCYDEGVGTAYERVAQMLVYGINGMPVETESWAVGALKDATGAGLISADNAKLTVTDNQANSLDDRKGLLISSVGKASGADAEGASFRFNDKMAGEFDLDFRVNSAKTYDAKLDDWSCAGFSTTDNWKYYYEDVYNPYADVKEVAFTFTSVTNPSQWFTVYIHRGVTSLGFSEVYTTSARVQVSGDSYYITSPSENKYYGYGLRYDNGTCEDVLKSYTALPNTSFSNYAVTKPNDWTYPTPHASNISFDPVTMKVYARGADMADGLYTDRSKTKDYLVRDLTNNDGVIWTDEAYKAQSFATLSAKDFVGGYTVSVAFTKMTDDATVANGGDMPELSYDTTNGYEGFTDAYARNINMTIYSLNGQELYYENGQTGKIWDLSAPQVSASAPVAIFGEAVDVTPVCYDVLDGNTVTAGRVYLSTDGGMNYNELTAVGGKFTYTPTTYNSLTVKYEGFTDSVGNTKVQYSNIPVQDLIVPTLAFKDDVIFRYDFTDGKGAKPQIDLLKDVYLSNPLSVKTYQYEIESITLPNGVVTKVTKLNYLDAGEYVVVYKVTDNFGNVGTLTRTIVAGDFSAPVINTAETYSCTLGEKVDLTPEVSDYDTNPTVQIIVKKDGKQVYKGTEFKAGEAGEYTVCYKAVDESGNLTEKEVKLIVTAGDGVIEEPSGMDTGTIIAIALFVVAGVGIISAIALAFMGGKEDEE